MKQEFRRILAQSRKMSLNGLSQFRGQLHMGQFENQNVLSTDSNSASLV
jgi:hypothetical protein